MRIREILRATAGTAVLAAALLVPMTASAESGEVDIEANNESTIVFTVTNATVNFGNVGPDGDNGGDADASGATYCRTGPTFTIGSNVPVTLGYSASATTVSGGLTLSDVSFNYGVDNCDTGTDVALGTGGTFPVGVAIGQPQDHTLTTLLRVNWNDTPGAFSVGITATVSA
jgi:hypothetical protein